METLAPQMIPYEYPPSPNINNAGYNYTVTGPPLSANNRIMEATTMAAGKNITSLETLTTNQVISGNREFYQPTI